jgi:hypothetical protein
MAKSEQGPGDAKVTVSVPVSNVWNVNQETAMVALTARQVATLFQKFLLQGIVLEDLIQRGALSEAVAKQVMQAVERLRDEG